MAVASTKARVLWSLTIATMMLVATYLCQRFENSNISLFDGSFLKQHYVSVFIFTCDDQSRLFNRTHRGGHFSKGGDLQQIQIEVKLTKCCFHPFLSSFQRRTFVQSMVASIKNHTGQTNYSDHEISLVLFKQLISGWGFNTDQTQLKTAQEKWLSKAVNLLYKGPHQLVNEDVRHQVNATLEYASQLCPDRNLACMFSIAKGQNLIMMLLDLRIRGEVLPENPFKASKSVNVESSAGTTFCIAVDISNEGFSSRSGVGNGIEMIVDLETFDNGDMNVVGDGADIQVTDPRDNSLVQLRGFCVSPGTSVNVKIRPNLFSITEGALGFNYIDRKCIEPSVDKELNYVEGKYSLSNCLFAATLDEIFNK